MIAVILSDISCLQQNTYDFFIIDLETTNYEVHRLLTLAILLVTLNIDVMGLVRRTFQVESIRAVDYL